MTFAGNTHTKYIEEKWAQEEQEEFYAYSDRHKDPKYLWRTRMDIKNMVSCGEMNEFMPSFEG